MTPFVAPLDDILFSLHHVARAPLIDGWDHDFAAEIGKHFAAFAEGEIAPIDEMAIKRGADWKTGASVCQVAAKRCMPPIATKDGRALPPPRNSAVRRRMH